MGLALGDATPGRQAFLQRLMEGFPDKLGVLFRR